MCFFFFFQAEDGIRDYKVTGVQTCALPIFRIGWLFGGVAILTFGCIALAVFANALRGRTVSLLPTALIALAYLRSEERRVGKECRSRRSPCEQQKDGHRSRQDVV